MNKKKMQRTKQIQSGKDEQEEIEAGYLEAQITIEGLRPLMMHKGPNVRDVFSGVIGRPEDEKIEWSKIEEHIAKIAEKAAYRAPDGSGHLCVPAKNLFANHCEAAKIVGKKYDKSYRKLVGVSLQDAFKGSVELRPQYPILMRDGSPISTYAIDEDIVKNQRGQTTPNVRARVDLPWSLSYSIRWLPLRYHLSDAKVREIVQMGGQDGVMDWRPTNGTFRVTSFEVEKIK